MEHINHPFREEMIFQTSMIMFHVNLPGCKWEVEVVSFSSCICPFPKKNPRTRRWSACCSAPARTRNNAPPKGAAQKTSRARKISLEVTRTGALVGCCDPSVSPYDESSKVVVHFPCHGCLQIIVWMCVFLLF